MIHYTSRKLRPPSKKRLGKNHSGASRERGEKDGPTTEVRPLKEDTLEQAEGEVTLDTAMILAAVLEVEETEGAVEMEAEEETEAEAVPEETNIQVKCCSQTNLQLRVFCSFSDFLKVKVLYCTVVTFISLKN